MQEKKQEQEQEQERERGETVTNVIGPGKGLPPSGPIQAPSLSRGERGARLMWPYTFQPPGVRAGAAEQVGEGVGEKAGIIEVHTDHLPQPEARAPCS